MVAIRKFQLPIGDWSGDGHGQCEWFTVESNKPLEEVREAHYKAVKLPLNIEEFQSEYLSDPVSEEEVQAIRDCGLDPNCYLEEHDAEDLPIKEWRVINIAAMAQLWIDLLMKADAGLKLTLALKADMLPFYGYDSSGQHISQVGYGLFK